MQTEKSPRVSRITKTTVDAAKAEAARYTVWDTELKGFGLRVAPTGAKTYIVRYRLGGGRAGTLRQLKIGQHSGALTADGARKLAKLQLSKVVGGGDPQGEKAKERAELTVSALCDLYLAEGCATKKPATIYTDALRIRRHIKPLLGKLKVSAVEREHVERFVRDVGAGKLPPTAVEEGERSNANRTKGGRGAATRTAGLLGAIFTFAMERRLRPDNPVRGVKRFTDRKMERFLGIR